MDRRYNSLTLIILVGLIAIPSVLFSYTTWYTKFGDAYIPVPMYADPDGTPNFTGEFAPMNRGGRTWNAVSTSYFSFRFGGWYEGGVPSNDDKCQTNYAECGSGILGITWLVTNGPNRECDTRLDINTPWNVGPDPTLYNEIDLESVACHEFGHTLGLGHSSVSAATMYAYINYGNDTKRTLDQDDINGITYLYPSFLDGPLSSGTADADQNFDLIVSSTNNLVCISFSTNHETDAEVKILDIMGRTVQEITSGNMSKGDHSYQWNISNVPAGIYFVTVETNELRSAEKLVIAK